MKARFVYLLHVLVPLVVAVKFTPDRFNTSDAFLHKSFGRSDDFAVQDFKDVPDWQPQLQVPLKWSGTSKFAPRVQYFFAGLWILMIAILPSVVPLLQRKRPTNSQLIVGALMLIVFFGGFGLFTNIILFQSGHFKGVRPLTIIECIYFMSQVITTVGYGDITPAKPRGQVFVGLYVLCAMFIISMIVSDVVNKAVESVESYKNKFLGLNQRIVSDVEEREGSRLSGLDETSSSTIAAHVHEQPKKKHQTRKGQRIKNQPTPVESGSIDQMLNLCPAQRPSVTDVLLALAIFAVIDISWIAFFSLYPGEGKNLFQAIYMSVITLSSVGFGAFTPVTEEGMIFSAFFMIFGTSALVNVITQFTELMVKLNEYEKHDAEEQKMLAGNLLTEMCDAEGHVSELQFLKFCLVQMKCIDSESLQAIEEAFQRRVLQKTTKGIADQNLIRKEILGIADKAT
jgi:hypothetical protein|mmetsp:Transcript_71298/g.112980  ORF Transcript_71298/g.112980 Transcript_71298/m.112980 type:complete len:455 (-) Transcript_71298:93-1457(-)|eukprot:CAMPEP_0169180948 /NCGR_PEP_ID=MMETSP1015-20121227/68441_1 /TAXON_ID=342587 /ORGANISM="Karlodinium micrum, Strain CCMP2283" /LENGTH=454 /DNA_ID=CAMNT_0009256087 /DNA_START=31 /DNA_END=1395 /DNA_ORIENTATION=+